MSAFPLYMNTFHSIFNENRKGYIFTIRWWANWENCVESAFLKAKISHKNYRPVLMQIDEKISTKYWPSSQLQEYIERIMHSDHGDYPKYAKTFFFVHYLQINQHDIPHMKLKNKNHMISSIKAGKLWIKFLRVYDKNSSESGHRGNKPQHNRGHIW